MTRTIWDSIGRHEDIKEYLVQEHAIYEPTIAYMKTAQEIIKWIDMSDCYPEIDIEVFDVETQFGVVEKLEVHGCWHNLNDPLYIKVTRSDGTIVFDGYGTDH